MQTIMLSDFLDTSVHGVFTTLFGTLLSFETNPALGDERICAAETLENMLAPPVGIPEHESFEVVLPSE